METNVGMIESELIYAGPEVTEMPTVDYWSSDPGKIFQSEVNNPVFFPVGLRNQVGTNANRVHALAAATKALSQGQFGQFPLYAFTDEGIWALSVSDTGTFLARQPVTRAVCVNPGGIVAVDSAVVFPTDRGIMQLSGSQTMCLSEMLHDEEQTTVLEISSLPGIQSLFDFAGQIKWLGAYDPLVKFCTHKDCQGIYDYAANRIVFFNGNSPLAYVLSLKSGCWTLLRCDFSERINSYPDCLVQNSDGRVLSLSCEGEAQSGLLVTRPVKLGDGDVLKTIDTLVQHGIFRKGSVAAVLWGSRDLRNWHVVKSSASQRISNISGTPYKYFRIGVACNLKPRESLSSATVQFRPKLTNRLR